MVAVAASPTPGAAAGSALYAKSNEHPPYKDMIVSAIEALKDQKGSSRKAISKYIADNYTGLPSTHAGLLTHHLRRLQQKGYLSMLKHSFKLAEPSVSGHSGADVGSKKRGRPPKNSHPAPAVLEDAPKRRSRPQRLANPPPAEKRESARLPKLKTPAAVNPASVYILPQAEQLKSGFLQSLPGAVAIILPEGLLSKKTARSPVLILPNGVQSLVEASSGKKKKKLGRPRKDLIQKIPDHPKESEKTQPVLPRRKAVVPKQLLLHNGHTNEGSENAAVKKPGRPRKNKNSDISENSLPKSPNSTKFAVEKPTTVKLVQEPNPSSSELKKKPVGRPRKTASFAGQTPTRSNGKSK